MARGADGISWEESKEHLIGIFEQLMLGIAYSDTDDEICELWHFMADNWDSAGHLELVQAIVAAKLYVGRSDECRPFEGSDPALGRLAAIQAAEARQADFSAVVEELVMPGGEW